MRIEKLREIKKHNQSGTGFELNSSQLWSLYFEMLEYTETYFSLTWYMLFEMFIMLECETRCPTSHKEKFSNLSCSSSHTHRAVWLNGTKQYKYWNYLDVNITITKLQLQIISSCILP